MNISRAAWTNLQPDSLFRILWTEEDLRRNRDLHTRTLCFTTSFNKLRLIISLWLLCVAEASASGSGAQPSLSLSLSTALSLVSVMRRFLLPTPTVLPGARTYAEHARHAALRWPSLGRPTPGALQPSTGFNQFRMKPKVRSAEYPRTSNLRPLAIGADLFPLANLHFRIIKCVHHLAVLRTSTPKSLSKTAAGLHANLHPAFNSESFKSSAKTIANTWLSSTLEALQSHYQTVITTATEELGERPLSPQSLDECLSAATKWARRQLGKKLLDLQLDHALNLIRSATPSPASEPRVPDAPIRPLQHPQPLLVSVSVQTENFAPSTSDAVTSTSLKPASLQTPRSLSRKRPRPLEKKLASD